MRYRNWHLGLLIFSGVSMALANDEANYMQEMDFIEFMGNWETADGEWISPDDIGNIMMPEKRIQKIQDDTDEFNEMDTHE